MKICIFVIAGLLVLGSMNPGGATPAADNVIKNALADIQRFETQASGLTPERRSNAKRILKLLNLSHERLNSSSNKADPSWKEVNQRYLALKAQLENLMTPAGATNQPASVSPATPTKPTKKSITPSRDTVPALVSGQRVRVKKMVKDMMNIQQSLVKTGPSEFQDPQIVTARQKRLNQFKEALTRYPQVDDPDVQAARKGFDALRQALSNEYTRAKEQLAQLGDVQKRLATIETNSRRYSAPGPLTPPFSEKEANAWVEAASNARTVAEHNLQELAKIEPIAYLPNNPGTPQTGAPYDADDVKRLRRNSARQLQDAEGAYHAMAQDFKSRFAHIEREVQERWQEDPKSDKKWIFIGEGRKEEAMQVFAEHAAIVQSAAYLESALGRPTTEALAVLEKVNKGKTDFLRNSQIALDSSRLPEPQSTDKKMLAIAESILKVPRYKFGEYGKIVLTTSEIVDRERKDSEIDIDDAELTLGGDLKMSGTQTTWTYKWKEFKFAVPLKEPDSDMWFIWWITAKNYSSGGDRTPLNQWVSSGKATKGNPILKKNM